MDVYSKAWLLLWRAGSNPSLREEGPSLRGGSRRLRQLLHGMESISHRFTTPMDQWRTDFIARRNGREDEWFFRVGVFAWIIVNRGPVGMTARSDGPFNYFWDFGCYLLPLAVLELYLRAKESAGPRRRFAMAGGLLVLTTLMGVGIFGVATFIWWPLPEAMK